MTDEPIIDLHSDHYFMGEALRLATRAYEAEEVPVGAIVVRADGVDVSGEQVAAGKAMMTMLEWSYADSPYFDYGAELFADVRRLFERRPPALDRDEPNSFARGEWECRVGAMEAAMTAAFAGMGIPVAQALTASLLFRFFYYLLPAFASVLRRASGARARARGDRSAVQVLRLRGAV